MDALYLLIPLSVLAMLAVLGLFAWALHGGQFDALEGEAARILEVAAAPLDGDQGAPGTRPEESP